jgi:hypothetical protein
MLFGAKYVNIEMLLKEMRRRINDERFLDTAKAKDSCHKMLVFIDYYLSRHSRYVHPVKVKLLEDARYRLGALMNSRDKEAFAKDFSALEKTFAEYVKNGSVYLLRHPEKSKEEGRTLTLGGVTQAKEFADTLRDEILMSPKPVSIFIRTSEIKRTKLFGEIIKHVNKSQKLEKNVVISEVKEHPAMAFGVVDKEAYDLLDKYIVIYKSEGESLLKLFLDWVNYNKPGKEWLPGGKSEIARLIQERKYNDPDYLRNSIESFVRASQGLVGVSSLDMNKDSYKIVIGIGHSHNIDCWLYPYTQHEGILKSAEFAKIELGALYFRGWHRL